MNLINNHCPILLAKTNDFFSVLQQQLAQQQRPKLSKSKHTRMEVKSIAENYNVGKVLGSGTFGDVLSAEPYQEPSHVVALKTLRGTSPLTNSVASTECFNHLREVIFFRNVPSHTNIIELFDMFQDSDTGNVVFALEHMRGNLFQLIEHHRRKNEGITSIDTLAIARIIRDILKGLEHIHNHGFVHRDLKPENVLWTGHGRTFVVKLADFGLSRASETSSKRAWTGYVATRWYRTPEQLLDLKLHTTAVDIWAVSLLVYEICNLAPLFPGKTTQDMIEKQIAALGVPSKAAVGGASPSVLAGLEASFGKASVDREIGKLNGFIITPEWLIWEHHECFTELMISGLQWDPSQRPSASKMLLMLRNATRSYQQANRTICEDSHRKRSQSI